MDGTRFDALTRTLEGFATRRVALKTAGAGGLAAALGALGLAADAKKKRKKKKRCKSNFAGCSGNAACCSRNCCAAAFDPSDRFCLSKSVLVCCPLEITGGCPPEDPVCCPADIDGQPFCCEPGSVCCEDSEGFGYCCSEGETCCETDPSGCCGDTLREAGAASRGGRRERAAHIPLR